MTQETIFYLIFLGLPTLYIIINVCQIIFKKELNTT